MVGLKPHGSSVAGAVGLSGHLSKLLIDTGVVKLWVRRWLAAVPRLWLAEPSLELAGQRRWHLGLGYGSGWALRGLFSVRVQGGATSSYAKTARLWIGKKSLK